MTAASEPRWLGVPFILAMHERLLAEHGGSAGVRDQKLLESALSRPRHLFASEQADLFALAAAYADGICNNRPFIDGNKRTGLMAAYTFMLTTVSCSTCRKEKLSR